MRLALALVAALAISSLVPGEAVAARKRGPGKPLPDRTEENCVGLEGSQFEACKVIGRYLDLGKAQKWDAAKKLIHPNTLEVIARTKKTTGEESHAMAPWFWAKHVYLVTDWKLGEVQDSIMGTVQISVEETRYQVEEDGMAEGEESTYLAGKHKGVWYVVDVQRGGGWFHPSSIKIGMKGYFDEEKKPETKNDEAPEAEGPKADAPKAQQPKIEIEEKPAFEAMGEDAE